MTLVDQNGPEQSSPMLGCVWRLLENSSRLTLKSAQKSHAGIHRRRSPSTLMKKLAKIVCAPSVRNRAAGITRRMVCE